MSPEQISALLQLARDNGLLPVGTPDEIAATLNSQRPKIRLPGDNRELLQFANDCGEVLAKRNLFRRDRQPVIVNPGRARLDGVTPQMLRSWSQQHIVFFKDKTLGNGEESRTIDIVKTMNVDTSRGLIESWHFIEALPEIERVNPIPLPMLRMNGAIELAPLGYFAENRTYTLDQGIVYDHEMSLGRAKIVIAEEVLGEMPFHDDGRSLSVQIAAMLTVFAGGLLPRRTTRPGFVYTANDSDAGKTLACKIAIVPIHGKVSPRGMPRKEEMRKVLDQISLEAAPVVVFDNIKGVLGGEDIEAFMSAALWQGRILGESGGFEVENLTTCFFSGNDCNPTRDMGQRCLFVELFLEDIDSSKRHIKNVLTDTKLAELELRNRICSALWCFVRHWDAQGRPPAPTAMPKCPEWSAVIAAIVVAAGFGDPLKKPEILSARGDSHEMRALVIYLAKEESIAEGAREEFFFADLAEVVQKEELFGNVELENKKGETVPMFDEEQKLTPAARSHFGKLFVKYHERLFTGENGERLRLLVEGKGNHRRYVITHEAPPQ